MVLNAAFYRFFAWPECAAARTGLLDQCRKLGLKGTILLSPEGVNGSICGEEGATRAVLAALGAHAGLSSALPARESWSKDPSFKRLKVRLKRRIISMGPVDSSPLQQTGTRLSPAELKNWLDKKRDFLLLDTRNAFEVKTGTFQGSTDLDLGHFHHFPERLEKVRESARGRPIVMFCTGGIRCERASAYALEHGIKEVYQLDGGILGYFAACGGAHFDGGCFVFDEREIVHPGDSSCA